jgi:hypothetical protein
MAELLPLTPENAKCLKSVPHSFENADYGFSFYQFPPAEYIQWGNFQWGISKITCLPLSETLGHRVLAEGKLLTKC